MTSQPSSTPRRVKHVASLSILVAVATAFATTVGMCGVANATGPQSQVTYELSGPGSITSTILIDGNVVSQATANGAPARTVCAH
ncbi:MAG: hypothetical protein JO045_05630 [Mycobacterium sp.]|nr:hypothetical protein [Mycobacterium sp.]